MKSSTVKYASNVDITKTRPVIASAKLIQLDWYALKINAMCIPILLDSSQKDRFGALLEIWNVGGPNAMFYSTCETFWEFALKE